MPQMGLGADRMRIRAPSLIIQSSLTHDMIEFKSAIEFKSGIYGEMELVVTALLSHTPQAAHARTLVTKAAHHSLGAA